jgi:hypothetical protein
VDRAGQALLGSVHPNPTLSSFPPPFAVQLTYRQVSTIAKVGLQYADAFSPDPAFRLICASYPKANESLLLIYSLVTTPVCHTV